MKNLKNILISPPILGGVRGGKSGFTLVELIVVITILVILGTIAFVNLGNFSNSARDSARISDITNISKGLELILIKNGTVPPPTDNTITLSASGTLIGYQGYFGSTNLSLINMSDARDPTDQKYYTYSTNLSRTKYQLLSLLEDPSILTSVITQTYAGYETRIPTTKGSSLGILLNNTGTTINQPIQELYNATSFTGVDVVNTMTGYIAIISNQSTDQFNGTGSVLSVVASTMRTGGSRYPGCDTYDIFITNGSISQTWAACNVGATTSVGFANIPAQLPSSPTPNVPTNRVNSVQGNYYQWGRNDNVTIGTWTTSQWTGALISPANTTGNTNFYQGEGTYGDWHWAGATNPAGGWNTANGGDNQGPCATGYHIPTTDAITTTTDWKTAALLIVDTDNPTTITQFNTIRSILKLPLAGYRRLGTGQYYSQSSGGWYWSSSPITTDSYSAVFFSSAIGAIANTDSYGRGHGFSVRCIKN